GERAARDQAAGRRGGEEHRRVRQRTISPRHQAGARRRGQPDGVSAGRLHPHRLSGLGRRHRGDRNEDVTDVVVLSAAGGTAVHAPFRHASRGGSPRSCGDGARGASCESAVVVVTESGGRTAMRKLLGALTALVIAVGAAAFFGLPRATAQGGGTIEAEVKYN